jgi:hypothetical protein
LLEQDDRLRRQVANLREQISGEKVRVAV